MQETHSTGSKVHLERIRKLFAMALHPETSEGETNNSALAIVRLMRVHQITLLDLSCSVVMDDIPAAPTATWTTEPKAPPASSAPPKPPPMADWEIAEDPFDTVMPWGKYQGKSLGWLSTEDIGYLTWLRDKATFTGKWAPLRPHVGRVLDAIAPSAED